MAKNLLVATDIFGATPALKTALNQLQSAVKAFSLDLMVVQPDSCANEPLVFADDQLAYQAFLQHGGLLRYQEVVKHAFCTQRPDFVLGFSAGAAALWAQLSLETQTAHSGKALLCYGGQIRQLTHLTPNWPVTCLWSDETHFDVHALQQQLSIHPMVQQLHWPLRHGFINPHSTGFAEESAAEFWQLCLRWLQSGGG